MELIDAKMASGPHQGTDVKIDAICRSIDSPMLDKGLLVRNPDILSETPPKSEMKEPNQPPLRMPVSGTPAADAPVAPPPGIAGR